MNRLISLYTYITYNRACSLSSRLASHRCMFLVHVKNIPRLTRQISLDVARAN